MRAAPVALLLAGLLSGCFGMCGPTYTEIRWTEPGLYASISGAEPALLEWQPGAGALPWNGSAWREQPPWPGLRLKSVDLLPAMPPGEQRGMFADVRPPHVERLTLERDGVLVARVDGNLSDADLRADFEVFLKEVADGNESKALWPAFLASREDTGTRAGYPLDANATQFEERIQWQHQVRVPGLRLDALAQRIALPLPGMGGVGQAQSNADPWTFNFGLPTWTVRGDPGTLRVDSADQAVLDGVQFGSEDAIKDSAREAVAKAGWTAHLDDAYAAAMVC